MVTPTTKTTANPENNEKITWLNKPKICINFMTPAVSAFLCEYRIYILALIRSLKALEHECI